LNLSITTVSRALDGYDDVAESTRTKVIQAAQAMGYAPSSAARQLRRRHADAIGYILPTSSPRFSDPFYAAFLTGICDEAADHQIDVIVSSSPPESDLEKSLYRRWFQSVRVDGMLLNRVRLNDWRIRFLTESNLDFVTLGWVPSSRDYPHIVVNERGGFERLVAHLVRKGHQRLAYIGAANNLLIQIERSNGYKTGLEVAGLPYDENLVVEGDLSEEGGYRAARKLLALANPPTAILGCNDLTAIGVLRATQETGLRVGKDLAITGFDGIQDTESTYPQITTLRQPTYEIARRLTKMLIAINKGESLIETRVVIEPELILRASTEDNDRI
jgi:LacI family transcriptional regulator